MQNGALAVPHGRSIADSINRLLGLSWGLRVATQDWHPQNHISFASNHSAPDNRPFQELTVENPLNPSETENIRLWPDHCVQDSTGAALVPELDTGKLDHIVKKGQDHRVEMFSAFKDSFKSPCVSSSDLAAVLRAKSISQVYVVGLATDYCVKHTAIHASNEGFRTIVLRDACKGIDESQESLQNLTNVFQESGVQFLDVVEARLT